MPRIGGERFAEFKGHVRSVAALQLEDLGFCDGSPA